MKISVLLVCALIALPGIVPESSSLDSISPEFSDEILHQESLPECFVPCLECPNPNITFHLYTDAKSSVEVNEDNVGNVKFNSQNPLKILIHGYGGHKDDNFNTVLRKAYQKRGDYNIISVDYSALVKEPCYEQGALNTQLASVCLAKFLELIVENWKIRMDSIHVIGFDFGAHVAGICTNCLKDRLGRITGLDPSYNMFTDIDKSTRLDADDAVFVDVIHTNVGRLGQKKRLGDVDFYVNGGIAQPGCEGSSDIDTCSHFMAPMFFSESITAPLGFWGTACKDTCLRKLGLPKSSKAPKVPILMGEDVSISAFGPMCVDTSHKSPLSKGRCEMRKSQTLLYDIGGIVMVVIVLYYAAGYFFRSRR